SVLIINRRPSGISHPKLKEIVHPNFFDFSPIESQVSGYNACFFCLGVSSVGMKEKDFFHYTYELTMHVAQTLSRLNPDMTFCYVSGSGTDSSEKGSSMWARVKGKTENALLALGFKAAYMFRPGYIQPIGDVQSKTGWVQTTYDIARPLYPLLHRLLPNNETTTASLGRAM